MSNNNTEEEVKTTTTTNNNDDDDDDDAAVTTSSSCPPHSNWSKDKLTGKSVSFKGLPVGGSDNSGNSGGRTSLLKRRSSKAMNNMAAASHNISVNALPTKIKSTTLTGVSGGNGGAPANMSNLTSF